MGNVIIDRDVNGLKLGVELEGIVNNMDGV